MSYVNRSTGNARSATIVAVSALHLAAVWALINGLGIDYIKEQIVRFEARQYKADPPPPAPEPPSEKTEKKAQQIEPARPAVVKDGPLVFTLPPIDPPGIPDIAPFVPQPGPSADPGPGFEAVGARPRGRPGLWVTPNDYPTHDIRAGNAGVVAFRLAIDASGKATGCEIVHSSGHPGLDSATCDKLMRRASFDPARDASGDRVSGFYTGTVRWVIPE